MADDMRPEEAVARLRSIDDAERAVGTTPVPRWYFRSLALGLLALKATQDTHDAVAITSVAVGFGVTIAVMVVHIARSSPFRLGRSYWPGDGASLVAWIVGIVVASVATGVGSAASGFRLAGTVTGVVLATGILLMDEWQHRLGKRSSGRHL